MKFTVFTAVLLVVKWVCLCSSLSDDCLDNMDEGQDMSSVIPVEIICTTLPNGTLNTWWTVRDHHVESVTLDYNCTGFGEDQAENLYLWVQGSSEETIADNVDLQPNASSDSFTTDPTCYVDGCFVWNSGRVNYATWVIPTVTCNLQGVSTVLQTTNTERSTKVSSMLTVTSTTSTTLETDPTTAQTISGGLKSYIWLVLTLLPILATVVFLLFLILWTANRRRQRQWWLYGNIRDKNLLHGNEPCIDPINRVKNDYFETITIVDPLEVPGPVQPGLGMTNIITVESNFLHDINQQAGDSDDHSFNESSSSRNDDCSMPVESARGGGGAENDSSSSCTQTMGDVGSTGALQSDSEEERLLTSNPNTDTKGPSARVRPTFLNLQMNCPSSTIISKSSHPSQMSNEVASPLESSGMVVNPTSIHTRSGGSDTKGASARVRPTFLNNCPSSTEVNKSNQMSNEVVSPLESSGMIIVPPSTHERTGGSDTKGASACVRPTSLNLQMNCPSSTIINKSSNSNQMSNEVALPLELSEMIISPPTHGRTGGSDTKGASARIRPTSLNLQLNCPSSTVINKSSQSNQMSNKVALPLESSEMIIAPPVTDGGSDTKGASAHVRPTSLNLQMNRPSSTEVNKLSHPNHIHDPTEMTDGRQIVRNCDLQIHHASNNLTNQSDSLELDSDSVQEQAHENINSRDQHSRLDSCDYARDIRRNEHHQYPRALQLSRIGPLYTIPEETQSLNDHRETPQRQESGMLTEHSVAQTCCPSDNDRLLDNGQPHNHQQHQYHDLSPSYISSSECTSSVYSSEQGTNSGMGYLADIEDMDSTSMQSNLESDEETEAELHGLHVRRNEHQPAHVLSMDDDDEVIEQLVNVAITNTLPYAQWYSNSTSHQPHLSEDEFDLLYYTKIPNIQLPDSPCSGYIGTLPPKVHELELNREDEDTFGLEDEAGAQPVEHADTPHSGYISNNPQNESNQVHKYQCETTV